VKHWFQAFAFKCNLYRYTEFPDTPVLIDHFGFCKGVEDPNWAALLSLAQFPQITVKASAQFRVVPRGAPVEWPYPTTGPQLRQLVDTFGVGRVAWGSDFPFVQEQCGGGCVRVNYE
jgi:predicted TIM-barrel fold metal-dependent hydrolase